jgi:CheY-like chemotaxis protein
VQRARELRLLSAGLTRKYGLDDHEIVRRGVKDLLEAEPDIRVVGEAGTASSALARIPALKPDVAVLDVRLPDGDGVSVCREIRTAFHRGYSTDADYPPSASPGARAIPAGFRAPASPDRPG